MARQHYDHPLWVAFQARDDMREEWENPPPVQLPKSASTSAWMANEAEANLMTRWKGRRHAWEQAQRYQQRQLERQLADDYASDPRYQ